MKSEITHYEPYDFTHMWGIQLKATNGQILKQRKTHRHRQPYGGYQRYEGWGVVKGEGVKYMVIEDDLTLGGGHAIQCTDDVK